jgi:hypothetical protein
MTQLVIRKHTGPAFYGWPRVLSPVSVNIALRAFDGDAASVVPTTDRDPATSRYP